ncbi:MAG: glycosyltransferase [Nitrospira sp.]|nr:glycosyltransferase [Nitrospira sp.]
METVCHVITKLELGGAQEVALYAVSHLDRNKFCPLLVTGPGGLLMDEAKTLAGVDVHVLSSLTRHVHALADLAAFVELVRLLRRLHPTIVHTHSSKAGILGRWAAWCARVPVIIHTIHGYGITPAQSAWLRRALILLERMTGWITTHWIAVAQADVEKGITWRLFDRTQVSVVRPGIDPHPFQTDIDTTTRDALRTQFGVGPSEYLVGTVVCLKPQKAPEDFVAVAKQVCNAVPNARFVLIGDGDLRPRIESLIEVNGLQERLHLAGWRRDIPTVMKIFDAFLLTSHWEGLPRVLLEARAIGLPVVATKVGGVEEVIVQGRHGWLSDAGDITGLSAHLVRVLKSRDGQPQGRLRSVEALPKEFHLEEMVKQYESLYDRFVDDLRGGKAPRSVWSTSHS